MDLEALFAEADEALAAVEPTTVPVVIAKRTMGVRFLPMSSGDWRHLAAQHPPRVDVPADRNRGYNVDAVVAAYPRVALIAENGDVDDLMRANDEGETVSQWPEVWSRLTARSQTAVATEIWASHELTPDLLVEDAGKA